MKKIVIRTGFHPEIKREYRGEHIYKVTEMRRLESDGTMMNANGLVTEGLDEQNTFYRLEHGGWLKSLGDEKYITDWCSEERWGRVEELELDGEGREAGAETLGFMILRVDRASGVL